MNTQRPDLHDHADERTFTDGAEARRVADEITAMPRKGKARAQFVGAMDAWVIEIRPRKEPYSNPRILRVDGTASGYHRWTPAYTPVQIFEPSL